MAAPKTKEKEAPPAEAEAPVQKDEGEKKAASARKWKGKDWYVVQAPDMFGGGDVGEIPATDPETLMGRTLVVPLSQVTGNPSKYYQKLTFKVAEVKGSRALTQFVGMRLAREHAFRLVRKRTAKVEVVTDVTTKDGWALHVKIVATTNRAVETEIQHKVRRKVVEMTAEIASKFEMAEFIKQVCEDLHQKNIKKYASKIYPIRYCDVEKVEVMQRGK
ncbi:MAG: 30S ribosomal protein S3ae [Candidatus Aenigmarchaeota archaeon]|nr:30S ribosomal protein S3ae [Candidatus Aenigmarchaeota archaeon]